MKRYLLTLPLVTLTALTSPPAQGSQTEPIAQNAVATPLMLTWQDCVNLAARQNPDLLAALQTMEASRADYKGSYNGILPHASVSNSYNKSRVFPTPIWTLTGNASLDLIDLSQWASIQTSLAA